MGHRWFRESLKLPDCGFESADPTDRETSMCGIFGIAAPGAGTPCALEESVDLLLDAIARRGPDGQGIFRQRYGGYEIVLGHTRLAVIDLSEQGRQPMEDPLSDWRITFNGEIYNFVEIRQTLEKLGWKFTSATDTEVLLKAWSEWGISGLHRLNGMFAFAAFNKLTGELWLVRDRFGVKPLLWASRPEGGIVFSSSVAAVSALIDAQIDLSYCARALRYRVFESPGSEAPFKGVNAVDAGGWLKVQMQDCPVRITSGRWYDLSEAVTRKTSAITSANDMDVLAECQHLLEDSVRLRLRSDVPLAVSLSGGLDSSTVAAYSARHVAGLEGFTYGAPNDFRSEGPVVAAFSRAVGIDCNYIWPQHGPLELDTLLERVLKSQEAPFGGLSVLAQNEVFRRVRESGFKVLLGGQGGDEAFAGYRKFFIVAVKEALRKRSLLNVGRLTYSMGLMLAAEVSQARWYWQALSRYNASKGFKFRLVNWASPSMDLWGASGSTLSSRQELDILQLSLPTLLRLEDRNSMGYGLETRLPFLDYRVIEMALALPARLKIAKGYGKWALRRISEGVVPDSIRLTRKKRGFDVAQSWVERGIGASLRRRLHENRNALSAHLRPGIDLDRELSIAALARDGNLLDEALMLAWLAQPVRI